MKKILYAVQGTGNGHVSRARAILPRLGKEAEVDVAISGTNSEVTLDRTTRYTYHGLSYTFGKTGGIDYFSSFCNFRPLRFLSDLRNLPVKDYDFVISDFEPVSAWAARRAGVPCIGMSHQASFFSQRTPRPPRRSRTGELIFRHYAPCNHAIGFHYKSYDDFILTPVIQDSIRKWKKVADQNSKRQNFHRYTGITGSTSLLESRHTDTVHGGFGRHVTVYLPAWDDSYLVPVLRQISGVEWQVFSKTAARLFKEKNVTVSPVDTEAYQASLAGSIGLVCGAGFEAPSEAMYLGKPVMVIPMNNQYEQLCNAEALRRMGVTVCEITKWTLVDQLLFLRSLDHWLVHGIPVPVNYPDITEVVISRILNIAEMKNFGKTAVYQSSRLAAY